MQNLVLVYELKTNDHKWLEEFYPVRRFRDECKKHGVEFIALLEQELKGWFESLATLSMAKQSRFLEETLFLLRGRVSEATYLLLKLKNAFFVNTQEATKLASDKLQTSIFCQEIFVPHPKTFLLSSIFFDKTGNLFPTDNLFKTEKIEFPIVVKPRFGLQGRDISVFFCTSQLKSFLAGLSEKQKNEFILQKFVGHTPDSKNNQTVRDLRIIFCNNKVIGSYERTSPNFCTNSSQGATCKPKTITKIQENLALKIAKKSTLFLGSVDFLFEKDGSFVLCEINHSPGFEATEKSTNQNIIEKIVQEVKNIKNL